VIDLAAERARLAKEMAKADADIARVDAKLGNPNFVARRRKKSSKKKRRKREEAQARKAKIAEALERLQASARARVGRQICENLYCRSERCDRTAADAAVARSRPQTSPARRARPAWRANLKQAASTRRRRCFRCRWRSRGLWSRRGPKIVMHQLDRSAASDPIRPSLPLLRATPASASKARAIWSRRRNAAARGASSSQSVAFAYADGKSRTPRPIRSILGRRPRRVTVKRRRRLEAAGAQFRHGAGRAALWPLYGPGTWSEGPTREAAAACRCRRAGGAAGAHRGRPGIYNIAEMTARSRSTRRAANGLRSRFQAFRLAWPETAC
jgi:hypothetical protein